MTLDVVVRKAAGTLKRTVEAKLQGPKPQKQGKGPQGCLKKTI